jgi:aminotransferase in exopolysaccharide biosynthesis|tara:strand:+ start:1008 stop:2192 length:1185 start_codon:yes stop_codon:yes gene_type:complete
MINLHEPLIVGNEKKYIKNCLENNWVSSAGKYVNIFERKIAKYTKVKYAVACINGTSALQLSLKLVGVKKDDEVIVPSITFIAPVNAIHYNGAKPIFMDCDKYYTIDENKTINFINKETITITKNLSGQKKNVTFNKKTRKRISAIIIVHVFGNAAKFSNLINLCKKKNIALVEDAAESIGTFYNSNKYNKKHTGTIGNVGCLSFNGNKIITTGGGGMILTNNKKIAQRAKYLTTQAKDNSIYSIHNEVGYNFRLTNIQAALGLAQLELLPKYIQKKQSIHKRYKKIINTINNLSISDSPDFATSNYWLNILEISKKLTKKKLSKLINYLKKNGIEVKPLWYPNHLQKKYKDCQKYKIKNINKIYLNRLCLPSGVGLTNKQQNFICKKLKKFFC